MQDEFDNAPDFTWYLTLCVSDRGNDLLTSLEFGQEFTWYDPDLSDPERSGVGEFEIEQSGFGGAIFILDALSVRLVGHPIPVPEPNTIGLALLGLLMFGRKTPGAVRRLYNC